MIHSMVEFVDGSTIAQAGPPRMLVPIALWRAGPSAPPTPTCRSTGTGRSRGSRAARRRGLPRRRARPPGRDVGRHLAGRLRAADEGASTPSTRDVSASSIVDTIARVVEAYAAEPLSEVTDLTLDDVLAADRWAREAARHTLPS